MLNTISSLNRTLLETQDWLDALTDAGPFETEQQAYSHLRAVLHAVRDRLTAEEAAHLAAQLPMLVRGFYYEGWRPALAPNPERTIEEFLDHVRSSLHDDQTPDSKVGDAVSAVLALLSDRLSEGQIRHVRDQMPEELKALWPA